MSEASDEFVDLRGLRFHYRDWGGQGQPVVLVHGLASSSHIWNMVAHRMAERFRLVALDQRGHGESDKPDDGYDFDSIVGDLHALISALNLGRSIVIGHSWGGNVALHFGADYPEMTAGLVLVDGGFSELASRPGMTWERVQEELAPPEFSGMTKAMLLARAQNWSLGRIWGPEVAQALLANFQENEDGTIRPRLARKHHMRILRALWEQRSSTLYSRITCPVLMVPAVPPATDERGARFLESKREGIARAQGVLPSCRVLWMEDTIHDVPLHRPGELTEAVCQFVDDEVLDKEKQK